MKPPPPNALATAPNIPIKISNFLIIPLLLPPPPSTTRFIYPPAQKQKEEKEKTTKKQNGISVTNNKPATSVTDITSSKAEAISQPSTSSTCPTSQSHRETYHHLYLQQHAPRLPHPDTSRSLYAANLPVDATEGGVRALFAEQLGGARVERVEFEDDDSGGGANDNDAFNGHGANGKGRDFGFGYISSPLSVCTVQSGNFVLTLFWGKIGDW